VKVPKGEPPTTIFRRLNARDHRPAVAGPVHRLVGRHPWTTSRPDIFHEGGNLHELDARAHTVETGYPFE
jgi:hypothetical protein